MHHTAAIAAGFALERGKHVLVNRDHLHSAKMSDPFIKGDTDRFAYQFVKP